jgi:hypothetical protein
MTQLINILVILLCLTGIMFTATFFSSGMHYWAFESNPEGRKAAKSRLLLSALSLPSFILFAALANLTFGEKLFLLAPVCVAGLKLGDFLGNRSRRHLNVQKAGKEIRLAAGRNLNNYS